MILREATILVIQLALASALAFGAAEILRIVGAPMYVVLPSGEFIWAGAVLFFLRRGA